MYLPEDLENLKDETKNRITTQVQSNKDWINQQIDKANLQNEVGDLGGNDLMKGIDEKKDELIKWGEDNLD